jgi:hypothetical protein
MAVFCVNFNMTPSEFKNLTTGEIDAFVKLIEPKTDLTGLF